VSGGTRYRAENYGMIWKSSPIWPKWRQRVKEVNVSERGSDVVELFINGIAENPASANAGNAHQRIRLRA